MNTKIFSVHDFNNRVFTVKELKEFLNQFNDSDKVDFTLCADATWFGAEGEISVDVNDKTVVAVNF